MPAKIAVLIALLMSSSPGDGLAQDQGGSMQEPSANVLYEGAALPWSEPSGGVRSAALYGSPQAEGEDFTFRLEVPDGFEMAPHTHPVAEHMTVLSGRFFVGVGETFDREAAVAYGPGSYVVIAAEVPAYMWAEGPTVVQVHGTGPLITNFLTPPEAGGP